MFWTRDQLFSVTKFNVYLAYLTILFRHQNGVFNTLGGWGFPSLGGDPPKGAAKEPRIAWYNTRCPSNATEQ